MCLLQNCIRKKIKDSIFFSCRRIKLRYVSIYFFFEQNGGGRQLEQD